MIENLIENRNRNNINGVFSIKKQKFFYKLLSLNDYKKEVSGYNIVKKIYPVANLIFHKVIDKKEGILIYEFEGTIKKNHGLLVDIFANGRSYEKDAYLLNKILSIYKKAFLRSLKKTEFNASDVFFKDRIKSRLDKYYNKTFFKEVKKVNFVFCGQQLTNINLEKIISSLKKFFNCKGKKYCIISQCDPNDLNIGIKPIILDYLAGGDNPLMAEFAIFFWYNIAQGSYFSVLYNENEYIYHHKIFKKIDKVYFDGHKLVHQINAKRRKFLIDYIKKVINPSLKKVNKDYDWYEEFKNYLAMRIISVFDISKMSEKDKFLSLAYLDMFCKLNINKTSELIKIIEKL